VKSRFWIGGPGVMVAVVAITTGVMAGQQAPPQSQPGLQAPTNAQPTLADAQSHFYNARYEAAAALALALRASETPSLPIDDLAGIELRTSALLFQIKRLVEPPPGTVEKHKPEKDSADKDKEKDAALKNCAACPQLIAEFLADFRSGQILARTALRADPADQAALFFLGKLDLNYVWLQLGPLRKKTGWDEYWEARRSLDAVLKANPRHVRAAVARAWIDYIVDTRMPWGTRWVLGGGDRKQALVDVRAAAQIESDFFTHTEAEFALWEMQVRERDIARAIEVARRLAHEFPENPEIAAFLEARTAKPRR
jgi:hypothetical protein